MKASLVLGIDPSKSFFTATMLDARGEAIWKGRQFDMTREGIESLVSDLPEGDLSVGIEASGRIDDNLLAWFAEWALASREKRSVKIIRINPGQSSRFGGPKPRRDQTDGSDSEHVAEYTRVYALRLEAFNCDRKIQALSRLVSERQRLVLDLTATKNRIHEQLLVCFPEFVQLFTDPCEAGPGGVARNSHRTICCPPTTVVAGPSKGRQERPFSGSRSGPRIDRTGPTFDCERRRGP